MSSTGNTTNREIIENLARRQQVPTSRTHRAASDTQGDISYVPWAKDRFEIASIDISGWKLKKDETNKKYAAYNVKVVMKSGML